MKKVILSEQQVRVLVREMIMGGRRMLNEISSADAYEKFYKDKIPQDKYEFLMQGTDMMTPLHKVVLDVLVGKGTWDEELVEDLHNVWNKGKDARAYAIDHLPRMYEQDEEGDFNIRRLKNFFASVSDMKGHTETFFADSGFYRLYEDENVYITCTTSYAASKKYYGKSHWCTASDIGGNYNGWKMFLKYTGLGDDDDEEGPGILVQIVNKTNMEKTIQVQVRAEGDYDWGDICWYNGKHAYEKELVKYLTSIGFLSEGLVAQYDTNILAGLFDAIGGLEKVEELYNQTEKDVRQEYDYWEKKTTVLFRKRATEFIKGMKNGYDEAVLSKIADEIYYWNTNTPPAFVLDPIDISMNPLMLAVTFYGLSNEQNDWVIGAEENGDISSEFGREIWFVDTTGGQPKIVAKYSGEKSESRETNKILAGTDVIVAYLTKNPEELIDYSPKMALLERSTGKLLMYPVEPVQRLGDLRPVFMRDENTNHLLLLTLETDRKMSLYYGNSALYISAFDIDAKKYIGRINTDNIDTSRFCGNARFVKGNGIRR